MSRRRIALLLGGALLLACLVLLLRTPPPRPAVRLVVPPAPSPADAVAPMVTAPVTPATSAAVPRPAAPLPRASAPRALRPGEVNVCGIGIVQGETVAEPGQPARTSLPKAIEDEQQRQLEQQWIPALKGAPGMDAAIALLQGRTAELVRIAVRERDALGVQWAFQACQRGGEPDCALLPPRLWVDVEPDNGFAWLMLMSADPSARADALYRLTLASRFDERFGALGAAIERALPATAPAHQRASLLVHAMGIEAALPMPSYSVLIQACSEQQLADANRRQQCAAIAELMAARSETLVAHMIAARLGDRLGWPAERLGALRQRIAEATQRSTRNFDEATKLPAFGCAQLEALAQPIRDVGRLGEWRALTQPPAARTR